MKLAVCEFPDERSRMDGAWEALRAALANERPEVLVMPEMPFCSWIFAAPVFDEAAWHEALCNHDRMIDRLPALGVPWLISSRPIEQDGRRLNEAFVWSRQDGYRGLRCKWYLPDAAVARETTWFHQGDRQFVPTEVAGARIGVQLCSEAMYPELARVLGAKGAQIVAQPRAGTSHRLWSVATEMSAVSSGCFIATANRRTFEKDWFAGGSTIISPDAETLAKTTVDRPLVTATIDLASADQAAQKYPRSLYRLYRDTDPHADGTRTS